MARNWMLCEIILYEKISDITSWTHSNADIMALTFPVHSMLRSAPPPVISTIT